MKRTLATVCALAMCAAAFGVGTTNVFRVTPYVQRPAPDAMTVMWLAQDEGDATLTYWKAGTSGTTTLQAVRQDGLSEDVSGIRFQKRNELEYCKAPELDYKGPMSGDSATNRYDAWSMPATVPWQYRARLTGLEPDTKYGYRVQLAGGVAYENTFRTAPKTTPDDWHGFKFIYYSDSETEPADNDPSKGLTSDWTDPVTGKGRKYYATQTEAYASNICAAVEFGADLIVMAGDLAQTGSTQRDWDEFWRHNAGQLNDPAGSIPILAAPGNHDYYSYDDGGETGIKKFMSYLEMEPNGTTLDADQQERFHRVDYGPVTFIFLDGNKGDESDPAKDTTREMTRANGCRAPDFNEGTEQYEWLEAQLRDAREKSAFTFVVSHQCPFSVGYHGRPNGMVNNGSTEKWSGRALRTLLPLLHKYGVDGWLAGHDEMMERSVHEGVEVLPDGTRVPHSFSVWDMGIAGDGLRGTKFIENEYEAFRADTDSPEERDANGKVIYGGKHYGQLQVTIDRDEDGCWKATFDPIYILFTQDAKGKAVCLGTRHYADKQVRRSRRFAKPVAAEPKPVAQASVDYSNYVPTQKPQGIVVTFYDDACSRGIAWQTDTTVTEGKAWLLKGEYDETDDDLFDRTKLVFGGTCDRANDPALNCHRVAVTGLEPGNEYSYRIGGNGHYAYGRLKVAEKGKAVTIVNFNDVQTKDATLLYKAENTLAAAARTAGGAGKVDFLINGGDFCDLNYFDNANHAVYKNIGYRNYQYLKWGISADTLAQWFPDVPMVSSSGIHDAAQYTLGTAVNYGFKATNGGGCQSVDYGNVHVAAIAYPGGWGASGSQFAEMTAWLDADLRAAKTADWKVVCMHYGPYTTGDHAQDAGTPAWAHMLAPVLASNHVDLVLQAHDHTYSKTEPYRWNSPGYTSDAADENVLNLNPKRRVIDGEAYDLNPNGTYYVSVGCCGHRVGEGTEYARADGSHAYTGRDPKIAIGQVSVQSKWKDKGAAASDDFNAQMFGILRVVGDRLTYSFYVVEADGAATLVDALRICKGKGLLTLLK